MLPMIRYSVKPASDPGRPFRILERDTEPIAVLCALIWPSDVAVRGKSSRQQFSTVVGSSENLTPLGKRVRSGEFEVLAAD
jgi:hypothetical protein